MFNDALNHFRKSDPILYELAATIDPFILERATDHFIRLTRSIVGQQLSVKAASTIFSRFENLFPEGITPERILKMDDDLIRAAGISYPKVKYIKDLSRKVHEKTLLLNTLETSDEETIINSLTQVKGIGVWSAEMYLMFALARPDVFSTGDLGLKNATAKLYGIEKPTKEDLLRISEKWKPYRTYASRILWMSLDNAPK